MIDELIKEANAFLKAQEDTDNFGGTCEYDHNGADDIITKLCEALKLATIEADTSPESVQLEDDYYANDSIEYCTRCLSYH